MSAGAVRHLQMHEPYIHRYDERKMRERIWPDEVYRTNGFVQHEYKIVVLFLPSYSP